MAVDDGSDGIEAAEATAEETGGDVFIVEDADDYNQSQRLRQIHQARRQVRKAHQKLHDTVQEEKNGHHFAAVRLSRAVAYYGRELEPLMAEAGWNPPCPESWPYDDVRNFIDYDGIAPESNDFKHNAPPPMLSMHVFGKLNDFVREVGLGADFEDTDTDAGFDLNDVDLNDGDD